MPEPMHPWKRVRAAAAAVAAAEGEPEPTPRRRSDETPQERSARRRATGWGPADSAEDDSYGGGI